MRVLTGKILFNIFVWSCFSNLASANITDTYEELKTWLGDLSKKNLEEYIALEKDNDISFKRRLFELKEKCVNTELLLLSTIDQSKCFDRVKEAKLKYAKIRYQKRSAIVLESFNSFKKNLNELHLKEFKLIQESSPEDELFFEL